MKKRVNRKQVIPTIVKVISVFYFVSAFLYILTGIAITFFGSLLGEDLISQVGVSVTDPALLAGIGLFIVALGVLYTFVGKGLWKGKNWARIAAIILSSTSGLFYLINMLYAVDFLIAVFLIIEVIIVLYLLFDKKVKSAFL